MLDSKIIDLREYGIARKVDARMIREGGILVLNKEIFHVLVVELKVGEQLEGPAISESEAIRQQKEVFVQYQQIIGGG